MRGEVCSRAWRRGELLWEDRRSNLIVLGGHGAVAVLLASGDVGKVVSHVGFGTAMTPATPEDTELEDVVLRPVGDVTFPSPGQVAWAWTLPAGVAVGMDVAERGLFTADGTLLARLVRTTEPVIMEPDMSLSGTWTLTL